MRSGLFHHSPHSIDSVREATNEPPSFKQHWVVMPHLENVAKTNNELFHSQENHQNSKTEKNSLHERRQKAMLQTELAPMTASGSSAAVLPWYMLGKFTAELSFAFARVSLKQFHLPRN